MGVKGLQTYLEKGCGGSGAFFPVDIKEVVKQFKQTVHAAETRPPWIVVDSSCTFPNVYREGGINGICGYQYAAYERIIVGFVKSFRNIGVEPIFFFDGPSLIQKRNEWIQRKVQTYYFYQELMTQIWNGKYKGDQADYVISPCGIDMFERYVLSEVCNCKVIVSLEECDEEIALFAKQNSNVVAILSQDSDFVIFNAAGYNLSAYHLDVTALTTKAYSSVRLAELHDLDQCWLPALATLLGNDLLLKEQLKWFHLRITHWKGRGYPRFQVLIPAVTAVIKKNLKKGMSVDEVSEILNMEVFGCNRTQQTYNSIKISLQTYLLDNARVNEKNKSKYNGGSPELIHLLMSSWNIAPLTLQVLLQYSMCFRNAFEDLNSGLKPTAVIYREAVSRYCGILLKHEETNPKRKTIDEFAVYSENSVMQCTKIPVVFPPFELDLLLLFTSTDMFSRSLRVKTLLWALTGSERFSSQFFTDAEKLLQKIKPDYIIPTLVLYFLHKIEQTINLTVIDMFVRMFIVLDLGYYSDSSEFYRCPNYDAIHLCTLFDCGVQTVSCILSVLGPAFPSKVFARSKNLDGTLFQKVYEGEYSLKTLLENERAKGIRSPILDFMKLNLE